VARAHMPVTSFNGFFGGLLHPLTAFGNALPIVTLGLWASRLGEESTIFLLSAFVMLLCGAGFFESLVPGLPFAAIGIPLCLIAGGALVAFDLKAPLVLSGTYAAIVGLVIGYELWRDLPLEWGAGEYAVGIVGGSLWLFTSTVWLANRLTRPWMRILPRIVGSWVAAAGLMLLALGRSG